MLAAAVFLLAALPFPSPVAARGGDPLQEEADRLTCEVIELRARRKVAQEDFARLSAELQSLDGRLAGVSGEVGILEAELSACQDAYNNAARSLYMRGDVSKIEVLLGARELEEMWEDAAYFDRIMGSGAEALEQLKKKLAELEIKKRDLRETREKRERLAETLDTGLLDARIAQIEARLSEIGSGLRSSGGRTAQQPVPAPPAWDVPPPGELLNRIPDPPPLADFELTGMTYSGYTTCYGEEFQGTPTASGVIFNMYDYTCAHRTLPFGTWLLVAFRGRQVIVQVNDRGPFVPGRVLDLSYGAAQSIGLDGVQWTDFEIIVPRGG